jgi:hypothetical protein
MGKLSGLNAEGVTDLHSYGVGYKDGLEYAIQVLLKGLTNDQMRVGDAGIAIAMLSLELQQELNK